MRDKVKSSLVFLMLLLVLALSVCGFTSEDRDLWKQDEEVLEQQTQNLLDSMTLEQKVYQMFIVTPEMLTDGRAVTAFDETATGALREYPVGGLIYFPKSDRCSADKRTAAPHAGVCPRDRRTAAVPVR